jgi:PhzF family phenazine biosynthesis protein
MSQSIVQVDAFTDTPFTGNPAAVCVLDAPADADWMQQVAREMNLSETAFLHPENDGFGLRWFTPGTEVDLCGHATLASAHVLWETGQLTESTAAQVHTRSGLLTCRRRDEWIEMDFPSTPATILLEAPAGLLNILGVQAVAVGKSKFDYLVELATEAEVRAVRPDFAALSKVDARGVIVTAPAEHPKTDFVSRFFAPAAGVDEDPVTGSAHCCLAPFWAEKLGRTELEAVQASDRGGRLRVRLEGRRVVLIGKAVTVMTGELLWPPR